jgi:aryl-alcohol dehydrogenase-like predicted oxidoreductase
MLEYRNLGNTRIRVSEIGFGCGPTAGLMVKGTSAERIRVIARALDYGINFFDTASSYGDGLSETNLGQVLRELHARPVIASKIAIKEKDLGNISQVVRQSIEQSLVRLCTETIDVIQLHNRVTDLRLSMEITGIAPLLTYEEIMGEAGVLETLEALKREGKIRSFGFTTYGGHLPSIYRMMNSGRFQMINAVYNLLNPSAAIQVSDDFRGEHYGQVINVAEQNKMGVAVIRVLAGGVLTGQATAHPLAKSPKKSVSEHELDMERLKILEFILRDGKQNFSQVAISFALMNSSVSSVIVGFSSQEQMEEAVRCSENGMIDEDTLHHINELHLSDFGRI